MTADNSEDSQEPLIQIDVPSALEGERLDRSVAMMCGSSRSRALAMVLAGGVSVNGEICTRAATRLEAGDRLTICAEPAGEPNLPGAESDIGLRVVHEDAFLVVIDKPAGLVVHPGAGNLTGTLVNGLLSSYPDIATVGDPQRPGIVHRLDSGTSGLMVVAKQQEAYEGLVAQLAAHLVERTYTALVWGDLEHRRGVIDAPIGRSRRDPLKMAVSTEGRDARTHYEVDRSYSTPAVASLLTCRLETGRTHQIRVHLSSIGHPVLGDDRYGGSRRSVPFGRPFLHARELVFLHPVTGEMVHCQADLPDDAASLLERFS